MLYRLLTLAKYCLRIIFAPLKLLPTQNKVVMISRKVRKTTIDFNLLETEIQSRYPDTRVVILNHRMTNKFKHALEVLEEMYHLATSKACVIDAYTIPVSLLEHKKGLVIVQIWNALGAIKQFGHAILGRKEGNSAKLASIMRMHHGYTYATAGGKATIPHFAKAFNMDSAKIKPIGMPRVDYLLDKAVFASNKSRILKTYPDLKGKKVILYAPTFRKKGEISPQPLIEAVNYDKFALVIKQHDHDKTQINPHQTVKFANQFSSLELLSVADYVITDYSAVAFEAAVLDLPLFFWAYDLDKYKKNRGLNVEYEKDMPGVVSKDPKRIIDAIEADEYNIETIINFKHRFVEVLDGTSSKRIVDLLRIG